LRCPACGYSYGTIAYAPQDTTVQCPNCKGAIRLYLPPPRPGSIKFSWEYSREPPPPTGIRFLPKVLSKLLPLFAIAAGALILVASILAASFVLTSGSGNMTIYGKVYAVQSGQKLDLPSVRIEVRDLSLVTYTDSNGAFEVQDIQIGEHTLRLSLANHSIADYHIVAFPRLAESFDLELKPGSGYGSFDAGSYTSLSQIGLTIYSASGELVLFSLFLLISALLLKRKRHPVFVLASFLFGISSIFFLTTELTLSWWLLAAASVLSFAGMMFTWLGRDEFEDRAKWTIE